MNKAELVYFTQLDVNEKHSDIEIEIYQCPCGNYIGVDYKFIVGCTECAESEDEDIVLKCPSCEENFVI